MFNNQSKKKIPFFGISIYSQAQIQHLLSNSGRDGS